MNRLGTEPYAGWCGETGVNRPLLPVTPIRYFLNRVEYRTLLREEIFDILYDLQIEGKVLLLK